MFDKVSDKGAKTQPEVAEKMSKLQAGAPRPEHDRMAESAGIPDARVPPIRCDRRPVALRLRRAGAPRPQHVTSYERVEDATALRP